MKWLQRIWRNGSLTIVLTLCFLGALTAQILVGNASNNEQLIEEGGRALSMLQYLRSGHFVEATFENWESEFLQMAMYVFLTVKLRQRGSAESKPVDDASDPSIDNGPVPSPVKAGGFYLRIYKHSLSLAFALLFALAFVLHLLGSWRDELVQRDLQGQAAVTLGQWLSGPQFWFESFQNWQSEFLAVLALVVLTIWLREDGSPQSKPVAAPHAQTGS